MKLQPTYLTYCSAKPANALEEAKPECVFVTQSFRSGKAIRCQLTGDYLKLVPAIVMAEIKAHDGVQCTTAPRVAEVHGTPQISPCDIVLPDNWTPRIASTEPRLVNGQLVIEPAGYWLNSPEQQAEFESKAALAAAPEEVTQS